MESNPTELDNAIVSVENIQSMIFTMRDVQVMLDSDLARVYGVEVKRLTEQVKRNINRFPDNFRFQLTPEEFENLRSQIGPSKRADPLRSQLASLETIGHRGLNRK